MKRTPLNLPAVTFAGLVTTGLLALPISSSFASNDDAVAKRDDDTPDVVLVADDDDDFTPQKAQATNTRSRASRNTSGVNSNDHTNSRRTAVSRDRDRSRGDKTRDWTKDGKGGKKRDWSANRTNDRSRNDTRR